MGKHKAHLFLPLLLFAEMACNVSHAGNTKTPLSQHRQAKVFLSDSGAAAAQMYATTAPALPTCDPIFAKGLLPLLWRHGVPPSELFERAATLCRTANLNDQCETRIVEEAFRFSYDNRNSNAEICNPMVVAGAVREIFAISASSFSMVLLPYFNSPDVEIRNCAEGMLEASGFLVPEFNSSHRVIFPLVQDYINHFSDDQQQRLNPHFWSMLYGADVEAAYRSSCPVQPTRQSADEAYAQSKRENYVNYILYARLTKIGELGNTGSFSSTLDNTLYRELASDSQWQSRMFVIGLMRSHRGFESQIILRRLADDKCPAVAGFAQIVIDDYAQLRQTLKKAGVNAQQLLPHE